MLATLECDLLLEAVTACDWWLLSRASLGIGVCSERRLLQMPASEHQRDGGDQEREHQDGQSSLEKKASQMGSKVKTGL